MYKDNILNCVTDQIWTYSWDLVNDYSIQAADSTSGPISFYFRIFRSLVQKFPTWHFTLHTVHETWNSAVFWIKAIHLDMEKRRTRTNLFHFWIFRILRLSISLYKVESKIFVNDFKRPRRTELYHKTSSDKPCGPCTSHTGRLKMGVYMHIEGTHAKDKTDSIFRHLSTLYLAD